MLLFILVVDPLAHASLAPSCANPLHHPPVHATRDAEADRKSMIAVDTLQAFLVACSIGLYISYIGYQGLALSISTYGALFITLIPNAYISATTPTRVFGHEAEAKVGELVKL